MRGKRVLGLAVDPLQTALVRNPALRRHGVAFAVRRLVGDLCAPLQDDLFRHWTSRRVREPSGNGWIEVKFRLRAFRKKQPNKSRTRLLQCSNEPLSGSVG